MLVYIILMYVLASRLKPIVSKISLVEIKKFCIQIRNYGSLEIMECFDYTQCKTKIVPIVGNKKCTHVFQQS